ncbi:hypothetical protein AAC387_Pa09g2463 [Persea americana]
MSSNDKTYHMKSKKLPDSTLLVEARTTSTFLHKTRLDRPFFLSPLHSLHTSGERMLPQRVRKAIVDSPKKVATLIDLANLPSTLREFLGQSQISRLGCFIKVWSYIKTHNLQDPNNRNMVICDDKLKSILLGKPHVELAELPLLIKLHFPKVSK